MARYLYAIVPCADALPSKPKGKYEQAGVNNGGMYSVSQDAVAAVVSDVRESRFRPERRHLAAHHEALQCLMKDSCSLLPVSFGVVAEDPQMLHEILSMNQETFCEQLQRVDKKIEMGLRVVWDVPNIFEYFVAIHPDLKGLRNRLFRGDREPTQDEKIALGRRFEQLLGEDRARHAETVGEMLGDVCCEVVNTDPREETEVMSLACLVAHNGQEQFEEAVFEAANLFDDNYIFDYNGPWPPYNFVESELRMPDGG